MPLDLWGHIKGNRLREKLTNNIKESAVTLHNNFTSRITRAEIIKRARAFIK